jgi:hypothetical protein
MRPMEAFGLSRSIGLSLLMLTVPDAADMVSVVIRQTLVRLETPDAMRGRISAVNSIFIGASNPLRAPTGRRPASSAPPRG